VTKGAIRPRIETLGLIVIPVWSGDDAPVHSRDDLRETHPPPNLVVVFPDQFRIQSLGFWRQAPFAGSLRGGGDPVHTPHLDAFARQSLVLTRATSTAPVCSPFRGMLFTGCFPERNGVPTNCGHDRPDCFLRPEAVTFTDVLAAAGYACGYIGKYHLDFPHAFDPGRPDWYPGGWDVYTPPERRHGCSFWRSYGTFDEHKNPHYWNECGERHDPHRWSPLHEADVAADFIRAQAGAGKSPFALFVAMNPPHTPNASLDDCEEEDYRLYADRPLSELLVRPNVTGAGTEAAPYYFAQVTGVDRAFGRILAALDEAGIADTTLVVFTSDHGELLCSHGERGKNRIWSECFDIPFLARLPGHTTPRTDDLLLTPVDMMPTLLGLLGVDPTLWPAMDGSDYSGWWGGSSVRAQRPVSVPFLRNQPGPTDATGLHRGHVPTARGIKTHCHTLVFEDLDDGAHPALLYDDAADPCQMTPLSPVAHRGLMEELSGLLTGHCERMHERWRPPGLACDRRLAAPPADTCR
jgi:arylsulfatase A-like enzyme